MIAARLVRNVRPIRHVVVAGTVALVGCSSSPRPPASVENTFPEAGVDASIVDGSADGSSDASSDQVSEASGSGLDAASAQDSAHDTGADAAGDAPSDSPITGVQDEGDAGEESDAGEELAETGPAVAPSCSGAGAGQSDCGHDAATCCDSLSVPGGDYFRSYDGVTAPYYTTENAPAAVSAFRLDRYEVTVGRFRQFVGAVVGGWTPSISSGKHSHLNSGSGLVSASTPGTYEAGWDSSWNANLARTTAGWNANLLCQGGPTTWTASPSTAEDLPVTCVDWYEAYAFCIWDGGFLPSESEWNYAAAGGSDQRAYPWSVPSSTTTINCTYANYSGAVLADGGSGTCAAAGANAVGSESPLGDGQWGQSDLAGNVSEWVLDYYATYNSDCADCAYLANTAVRALRGGGYTSVPSWVLASFRDFEDPAGRRSDLGVRCARAPNP